MTAYVELHAASAFSFLEGASLPEELAGLCSHYDVPAIALLDRDGVYGAPRLHLAANKLDVRAHIGAELTVQSVAKGAAGHPQSSPPESGGETRTARRGGSLTYPLLAESQAGYQNLCRLITRMKMRARKGEGSVNENELEEFAPGVVCLTGGDHGPLTMAIREGGIAEGRHQLKQLVGIFGPDNVYVELQRHFDREEEAINHRAIQLAREFKLPLLATNGVRYATRDAREILDVFTCIHHHRTLETAGRLLTKNAERHLKTPREMCELFRDLPEAIGNTVELSARLQFTMKDLGYEFPRYPVPAGETMTSYLRQRTYAGAAIRFENYGDKHRQQLERELHLIQELKLEGYFLIVWDIVEFCREHNILVQGRGSAANSAVCFALGITAVDSVKMDLLFERFLSRERGEWPDIDLDLPSGDQRERAIQYIYERYGKLGAAMTANVITYRGKSAAREVGKVLGFDLDMLDRLAKLVSAWEYQDSHDTLETHFRTAGFDIRHPRIGKFLALCLGLQELPRHLGQHSGGMVICQGQLDSVVPLEPASMANRTVVQWDKDDCADMGIIKVDLLGLGMMAVLEDSLQLIRDNYHEDIDLPSLPQDDPDVYTALQKADTVGMFQVESRAQMSCLPRMCPDHFYDIVVQVAIIRPGPIVGKMVHPYLKRRQRREDVSYPHPSLKPVLERTLGIPLFQEQLLSIAMTVAGFTGGEAEELRRAFGFKRSEKRMKEVEVKLRAGMERNGIIREVQEQIVQSIVSFALYGFPESHAISFALIAYSSAYLKCHYLPAFTAAILNNQPMGFYSPATLVKDAQRHGLHVLPIDITRSNWLCALEQHAVKQNKNSPPKLGGGLRGARRGGSLTTDLEGYGFGTTPSAPFKGGFAGFIDGAATPPDSGGEPFALRLGLRYVRGLRKPAADAIACERDRMPFTSVDDLVRRVPELQKDELVMLAEIGALNFLNPEHRMHRRDALWQVERAARRSGPLLEEIQELDEASPLQMMTSEERIVADFYGTGMTVGPHPMTYCRAEMNALGVKRAVDLQHLPDGQFVRIAGCVIARQRPGTAHGFVFLSLEDETGISNAILRPDVFQQNRYTIVDGKFLVLEGRLQNVDNVISVKVSAARKLSITNAVTSSHDFH